MKSFIAAIFLLSAAAFAQTTPQRQPGAWWSERAPGAMPYRTNARKLPLISVKGNKFVGPDGNAIVFRGLAISDPDKIERQGHWNRDHFVKVKEMGAKVVRIPVHPVAWRGRGPAEYIKLLDQAVEWCTDLDMYIMLDWHSIGNLTTGLFQDPMYETSLQETYAFWRIMGRRYAGHNTIAFWELFNEPTTFRGQLGPVVWADWKKAVENEITIIRAYNPQALVLVAGFDWAYDLTPLREEPINAQNIGYVTHPYSNKRPQPWEPKWEEDFGFAASQYPIFATEFGGAAAAPANATQPAYGPSIFKYLEGKGISWTVWCFDPEWGPTLISNWDYKLTPAGEYAKQIMLQGGWK
ncbi:MAG: glycoside hydrolase family 5 protein [Acidobacteriia bacterium]|nr:glycoside hydrolase family 5 protein [Terriglobia bacterium]